MGSFATGVTIITLDLDGEVHGMTANAFVSVSLDPPLVLVSLDNRSYMHKILPAIGRYGVSVLSEDQEIVSNHFAGRTVEGLHLRFITRDGVPLLDGAVAYFVVHVIDAERHRAVVDTARMGANARSQGRGDDLAWRRRRRHVDVGDRPPDQGIAHRAADDTGFIPRGLERGENRLRLAAHQPIRPGKTRQFARRGRGHRLAT